jgi:hypothetical protein
MSVRVLVVVVACGAIVASCTNILGIDGNYVAEPIKAAAGGRAGGGSGGLGSTPDATASTGGTTRNDAGPVAIDAASGGGTTVTDSGPPNDADASPTCASGYKLCAVPGVVGKKCVTPDPSVGCGPTDCARCALAIPANAFSVCAKDECAFACSPGYEMNAAGTACDAMPTGSGGSTSTSSGGSGGQLSPGDPCQKGDSCGRCITPFSDFPGCCDDVFVLPAGTGSSVFTGPHCGCNYVAACI